MGMAQHARRQGLAKFGWNYYNYKNFCRMMYMGKNLAWSNPAGLFCSLIGKTLSRESVKVSSYKTKIICALAQEGYIASQLCSALQSVQSPQD